MFNQKNIFNTKEVKTFTAIVSLIVSIILFVQIKRRARLALLQNQKDVEACANNHHKHKSRKANLSYLWMMHYLQKFFIPRLLNVIILIALPVTLFVHDVDPSLIEVIIAVYLAIISLAGIPVLQ